MVLFLFNIKFKGLPPTFFLASVVFAAMAFFYYLKGCFYPKALVKPILFLLLFLLSMMLTALSVSTLDTFLINIVLGIVFIVVVVPFALISHFKCREIEIIKYTVYAGIINSFFLIGMFLIADFREFYLSLLSKVDLLHLKGEGALNSLYAMRLIGLTGSATYGMAVVQIVMSFLYVFYIKKSKNKFTLLNHLILLMLIMSAILSGRTAFIGLAILIPYLFFTMKIYDFLRFCIIVFFSFIAFIFVARLFLPENFYAFFEQWILQLFLISEKIGSIEVNKAMLEAYSLSDFSLLGDFKWHADATRSSYYMSTDVGWYRLMFAFGYIGLVALLAFLMSFIRFSTRLTHLHVLMLFIFTFLVLVMFKGAILFDFYMVFFIFSILKFFFKLDKYEQN